MIKSTYFPIKQEAGVYSATQLKPATREKAYVSNIYLWVAETRLQGSPSSDGQNRRIVEKAPRNKITKIAK